MVLKSGREPSILDTHVPGSPWSEEYTKAYRKAYAYDYNRRPAFKAKQKEHKARIQTVNVEYVGDLLNNSQCASCGIAEPWALQFHHVTGEKRNVVSKMVPDAYALEKIKDEIKKCIILCANCHQIETIRNTKSWRYKHCTPPKD